MNLSRFITSNIDSILAEWERFARTLLPSAATMDSLALRDHARQILEAIARDILIPQTSAESGEKSRGKEDCLPGVDTAAAIHGTLRHGAGYDMRQLFAEYRALRASVLRLWSERAGDAGPEAFSQMTRFNEAIDQALAESVARFSEDMDRARDTFMAVLGDDLRMPLQVISASASDLLQREPAPGAHARAAARIPASVLDMNRTISDLLEYTRARLGKSVPIHARQVDVQAIVRSSLGEMGAGHPQCSFRVETGSDLMAFVDSARLQQAITNLISNAVEHGRKGGIVDVIASKDAAGLAIAVSNEGAPITPEALQAIFDPMQSAAPRQPQGQGRKQLGLGLFVAREIVAGHGGSIEVASGNRTTFTIRIPAEPRGVAAAPAVA